ncbi:MAG: acetyltransferase [Burkholderiaceae bacterium]|nr:acetyltransferase [Burkholderiaceae bacterium]
MKRFDVFNGDADGLCALHQLRLENPASATLVTGTKRDNALLGRVAAKAGDEVTALDLALPGNRDALLALLARGVRVRYVDHHEPGEIPRHPLLDMLIDTDAEVCTSVLVDRLLGGAHRAWAVVGAYGDNLHATASRLAATIDPPQGALARWRALGECLNYNAYGLREQDLIFHPAVLYRAMAGCATPDEFISTQPHQDKLARARQADFGRAASVRAQCDSAGATLRVLPDADWARRVFGSFANHLAADDPHRAHAVAAKRPDGSFLLSLRVPPGAGIGAHEILVRFGGGGRQLAAGVDRLSQARLAEFGETLRRSFATPVHG